MSFERFINFYSKHNDFFLLLHTNIMKQLVYLNELNGIPIYYYELCFIIIHLSTTF